MDFVVMCMGAPESILLVRRSTKREAVGVMWCCPEAEFGWAAHLEVLGCPEAQERGTACCGKPCSAESWAEECGLGPKSPGAEGEVADHCPAEVGDCQCHAELCPAQFP